MNENTTNNNQTEAMDMKLDVSIRNITPVNNLLAFANVKINDCFVVEGVKILTGEKGLFVNMPSTQDGNGGYRDVCFPVTADFRQQLVDAVLDEFNVSMEKMRETLDSLDAHRPAPKKESVMGRLAEAGKQVQAQTGMPPVAQNRSENAL